MATIREIFIVGESDLKYRRLKVIKVQYLNLVMIMLALTGLFTTQLFSQEDSFIEAERVKIRKDFEQGSPTQSDNSSNEKLLNGEKNIPQSELLDELLKPGNEDLLQEFKIQMGYTDDETDFFGNGDVKDDKNQEESNEEEEKDKKKDVVDVDLRQHVSSLCALCHVL